MSSTALLNPNTEVAKTKKSKQKTATLSYEDAVAVLRDCDERIKAVRKIRTHDDIKLRHSVVFHTVAKTYAVTFATNAALVSYVSGATEFLNIIAAASIIIPVLSIHIPHSIQRAISPFAARKEEQEKALSQAFYNLKEDHFKELKESILQEAEPAMDVINEQIKGFRQKIVYSENDYYGTAHLGLEVAIDDKGHRAIIPLEMMADLRVEAIRDKGDEMRRPYTNALTA